VCLSVSVSVSMRECVCVCVCGMCVCLFVCVWIVCLCAFKNFANYTDNLHKCVLTPILLTDSEFQTLSFVVLKLSLANGTAMKVLLTGSPVQVAKKLHRFMTDVIALRAFGMHGKSFHGP
jgi:hypothetical protein